MLMWIEAGTEPNMEPSRAGDGPHLAVAAMPVARVWPSAIGVGHDIWSGTSAAAPEKPCQRGQRLAHLIRQHLYPLPARLQ